VLISPVVVVLLSTLDPHMAPDRQRVHVSKPVLAQQQDPSAAVDDGKKPPILSWRRGKAFRFDFDGLFQEDLHTSYDGADTKADLRPFELQRSRIGVRGTVFRHIQFDVTREVTEKDVEVGKLPKSPWKSIEINLANPRSRSASTP
jgi:hypothetical protein